MKHAEFFRYWSKMRTYQLLREQGVKKLFEEKVREDAESEIIQRNYQFVCKLVCSWLYNCEKYHIDVFDLVSAGNIGLVQATRKFQVGKWSYFRYASRYISSYLEAEFYRGTGFPRKQGKRFIKQHISLKITQSLSSVVSDNGDDEPLLLEDVVSNPKDQDLDPTLEVDGLLNRINADNMHGLARRIVELRYGVGISRHEKPFSLSQSARVFGLSKEGVRKIEKSTLEYLASIRK